jgi:cytochrome c peroxidase
VWSNAARALAATGLLGALAGCSDDGAPAHSHGAGGHTHGDGGHSHADGGDNEPPIEPEGDGSVAPPDGSVAGSFRWELPHDKWPRPPVPADNPMSDEKVELGRHLFYDTRLSANGTFSCASCHKQELAFTDGRAVGEGSTGELHSRGSMSLANVGYAETLTWANPLMSTLERQASVPIFGERPIELGMRSLPELEARLREVERYVELFGAAFPDEEEPITVLNLTRALAAFQRTLISGDSAYDRYQRGDEEALSESAKRGMVFVTTNEDHRFECNHCHGGTFFTDHVTWENRATRGAAPLYHQTGLYDVDGLGGYPAPNTGIHDVTLRADDMGKFKAPTLRNIALTAPYMHDGSIQKLEDVLDHYARGGRAHVTGKTDPLLEPFEITDAEKADIIAFLESLTDEEFISNEKFSDPWR